LGLHTKQSFEFSDIALQGSILRAALLATAV